MITAAREVSRRLADEMRLSAEALTLAEADIAAGRVLVAMDEAGRTIGLVRVEPDGEEAELGLMFVDPPAIGSG